MGEKVYLGKAIDTRSGTETKLYARNNDLESPDITGITKDTNLYREDPLGLGDGYCCLSPRDEIDIKRVLGILENGNPNRFLEIEKA